MAVAVPTGGWCQNRVEIEWSQIRGHNKRCTVVAVVKIETTWSGSDITNGRQESADVKSPCRVCDFWTRFRNAVAVLRRGDPGA